MLSNRISERIRIPTPAIFLLAAAAAASDLIPALGQLSVATVERVVTVALVVIILFDGGMHIGWRRFRSAAGPVVWVGVAGTFVTAAALATLAHGLFGLDWRSALLVGTALAPTDPAVVSRCWVAGRSLGVAVPHWKKSSVDARSAVRHTKGVRRPWKTARLPAELLR